jgi:hypothetical protein
VLDGKGFRAAIFANGHPTDKISEFVDFHLRQHVEALPFFIKDTTDYLQKMAALTKKAVFQ